MVRLLEILNRSLFCVFASFLAGCGAITGGIEVKTPAIQDFQKTEILHNGSGIADGVSDLVVMVQLKHSDNSPAIN